VIEVQWIWQNALNTLINNNKERENIDHTQSCRPIVVISTESMKIVPLTGSIIRNRATSN
jgi:hypothetical protein